MMKIFSKGVSVIEIIIASSIISITVLSIIVAINFFIKLSIINSKEAGAVLLLEETLESVQLIRDKGWSNISNSDTSIKYHIYWSTSDYFATTTPQLINGIYTRTIQFQNVERDLNDDITSNGNDDPNTRKVLIEISWEVFGETKIKTAEMLIHNVYGN